MFATSYSSFPLTFAYAGQAEAPQGKGGHDRCHRPWKFAARLFIHAETHSADHGELQVRSRRAEAVRRSAARRSGASSAGPPAAQATVPPTSFTGRTARAGPRAAVTTRRQPTRLPLVRRREREGRRLHASRREPFVFRGLSRRRRPAASVSSQARGCRRHGRRNHLRPLQINARTDPRRFDAGN